MIGPRAIGEYWMGQGGSSASETHDGLVGLLLLMWGACLGLLIVVLLIALLRRPDHAQLGLRRVRLPSWMGRSALIAVSVLFLAHVFYRGVHEYALTLAPPAETLDVTIRATSCGWSVEYPNGTTPNEFVSLSTDAPGTAPIIPTPQNRPVRLQLVGTASQRTFTIPDLRLRIVVPAYAVVTRTFTPTRLTPDGSLGHIVTRTETCLEQPSHLVAAIRVVSASDFQQWLRVRERQERPTSPVELGELLYKRKGCLACHTTTGARGTGPTWKGLFGSERRLTDGSTVIADAEYLRESIISGDAKLVEGYFNQMPPYRGVLDDEEIDAIIEYIKTIKEDSS